MSLEQFRKKLNEVIRNVYSDVKLSCHKTFGGSTVIYGEQFDDIFQRALTAFTKSMYNQFREEEAKVVNRLSPQYAQSAIENNFNQIANRCKKKRAVRNNPDKISNIKHQIYNDDEQHLSQEGVEISTFLRGLNGKTKSMIMMRLRGDVTTEDPRITKSGGTSVNNIRRKLDMSAGQFYKALENIQNYIEKRGYGNG